HGQRLRDGLVRETWPGSRALGSQAQPVATSLCSSAPWRGRPSSLRSVHSSTRTSSICLRCGNHGDRHVVRRVDDERQGWVRSGPHRGMGGWWLGYFVSALVKAATTPDLGLLGWGGAVLFAIIGGFASGFIVGIVVGAAGAAG